MGEYVEIEKIIEACEQVCNILKVSFAFQYDENLIIFKHQEINYSLRIRLDDTIFRTDLREHNEFTTLELRIEYYIKYNFCKQLLLR